MLGLFFGLFPEMLPRADGRFREIGMSADEMRGECLNQARRRSADAIECALARWSIVLPNTGVDQLVSACVRNLGAEQKFAALLDLSEGSILLEAEIGRLAVELEEISALQALLRSQ
jgi:hypothetical protein